MDGIRLTLSIYFNIITETGFAYTRCGTQLGETTRVQELIAGVDEPHSRGYNRLPIYLLQLAGKLGDEDPEIAVNKIFALIFFT